MHATRTTTHRVTHAAWSPRHELVAVADERATLMLYRLPWKRIWTQPTELCVRALVWSPDGRQIVAGFEDGSLKIFSKEAGVELATLRIEAGRETAAATSDGWIDGVTTLSWTRRSRGKAVTAMRPRVAFPEIPTKFPKLSLDANAVYKAFEYDPVESATPTVASETPHDSVLCVGHRSGAVTLFLEANVPIARITADVFSSASMGVTDLHEIALTEDFETLLVIQFQPRDNEVSGALQLVECDCREIGSNIDKISFISLKASQLISLLNDGELCLKEIQTMWSSALEIYHTILRSHAISLEDLVDELIVFMALHVISDSMTRVMENALQNCHTILHDRFKPQLQKALMLTEDLCSLSDSQELLKASSFGLDNGVLHELKSRLMWILFRLEQIYKKLHSVGKGYRLFLCLLLFVRQITEKENVDDPVISENHDLLIDFMQGELQHESLLCEFQLGVHVEPSVVHREMQPNGGLYKMALETMGPLSAKEQEKGLHQQLMTAILAASSCLEAVKVYLGASVTRLHTVKLCGTLARDRVLVDLTPLTVPTDDAKGYLMAFYSPCGRLRSDSIDRIITVRILVSETDDKPRIVLEPSALSIPEDVRLVDVCLCGSQSVLALMEHPSEKPSELLAIELEHLDFVSDRQPKRGSTAPEDLASVLKNRVVALDAVQRRQRTIESAGVAPPLTANATGAALVVSEIGTAVHDLNSGDPVA